MVLWENNVALHCKPLSGGFNAHYFVLISVVPPTSVRWDPAGMEKPYIMVFTNVFLSGWRCGRLEESSRGYVATHRVVAYQSSQALGAVPGSLSRQTHERAGLCWSKPIQHTTTAYINRWASSFELYAEVSGAPVVVDFRTYPAQKWSP